MQSLSVFVFLFAVARLSLADRITTYKKLNIVHAPLKIPSSKISVGQRFDQNNTDIVFLKEMDERLDKLTAEAEEIRDIYNELIKTTFGQEMILKLRNESFSDEPMLGAPKQPSADWVRATINPMLLNKRKQFDERNATHITKPIFK